MASAHRAVQQRSVELQLRRLQHGSGIIIRVPRRSRGRSCPGRPCLQAPRVQDGLRADSWSASRASADEQDLGLVCGRSLVATPYIAGHSSPPPSAPGCLICFIRWGFSFPISLGPTRGRDVVGPKIWGAVATSICVGVATYHIALHRIVHPDTPAPGTQIKIKTGPGQPPGRHAHECWSCLFSLCVARGSWATRKENNMTNTH